MDRKINELVNDFKDYLLASDVKDYIVKMILFGSHARDVAGPGSDIDILIFTTDGISIEKSLMDRVYDFMVEHNAPLEVMTSSIDEFFPIRDYFVLNVIRCGVEVYSMEKEEIKKVALRDIKDLAEEYLESAKEVLSRKRVRLAIDAAYNAAELAAKALVLLKQDDLPGSHGGIVSLFGQLYVKTDEVNKEIGRKLNLALKLRNEARYKPNTSLTEENARDVLNLAKGLIEIVSGKIV